jgi:hypothetical protein
VKKREYSKQCGAERDRNRTVTQDTQQKESEIKKRRMKVSEVSLGRDTRVIYPLLR